MSTPDSQPGSSQAKGASGPPLHGGLQSLGRGFMPPIFTVFLTLGCLDLIFQMLLPFALSRGTDSPWAMPPRLAFLATSVLTGLAFGLLAGITADRRGHSAWWFLAGHLGAFLAPALAAAELPESHPALAQGMVAGVCAAGAFVCFAMVKSTRSEAYPYGALTRKLARFFFRAGNVWLGVSLLSLLIGCLIQGTRLEDAYGHKAAFAILYANWPFGLLYMAFATSLLSATLRKYPWRVSQTGWLSVHAALLLIIVGTFTTFWGKKEGVLALTEGQSSPSFTLNTETRLQVFPATERGLQMGSRPTWEEISDFDLNPVDLSPDRHLLADLGQDQLPIVIQKYYARAKQHQLVSNDAERPHAALKASLRSPRMPRAQEFYLEEDGGAGPVPGILPMEFHRLFTDESRAALLAGADNDGPARVVVRRPSGERLLEIPVPLPAAQGRSQGQPAPLAISQKIPGTEITLQLSQWYDSFRRIKNRNLDASPGVPSNPAVALTLNGPQGEVRRFALCWIPWKVNGSMFQDAYKDLVVSLEYWAAPRGSLWFLPQADKPLAWVHRHQDGSQKSGQVTEGRALDLGLPTTITPLEIYSHLKVTETWEHDGYRERNPVVKVALGAGAETRLDENWIVLGDRRGLSFRFKNRSWILRWSKTTWPLGFSLFLNDFHRDYLVGSRQPKTYESYLRLTDPLSNDPRIQPSANIKIDMNHPLRYRGWRLYQSRFAEGSSETTFLQVNRDPGLPLTYSGCVLLALGLVIVFFQKRFLVAWGGFLRRRGASARTLVLASLGVVLAAFLSCGPGVLLIILMSEGPLLVIGVMTIAAVLALETITLKILTGRLADRRAKAVPEPKLPAGVLS